MGPCTASSCCCQACNLHGPLYRLLMLLPGPESFMGPCTASHCCCLHRHTLPCATFRSPHTAGCVPFCHSIWCWQITGLQIAAARPVICHGPCTASSCCCQVQSV
ncbi:unnamed protein product [Staurois parvus]|uniref:Secreted protein n=1 Tax=Staurois parvus TaxID=386267 RepID=A0ABN9CA48_9NEOB|nr:unnamed protein product [Staurois parvus]